MLFWKFISKLKFSYETMILKNSKFYKFLFYILISLYIKYDNHLIGPIEKETIYLNIPLNIIPINEL